MPNIQTVDDFNKYVAGIEAREGYRRPRAFGLGFVRYKQVGDQQVILDVSFPTVNVGGNYGTAAVMAEAAGAAQGTRVQDMDDYVLSRLDDTFFPFKADGKEHPNIDAIGMVMAAVDHWIPLIDDEDYACKAAVVFVDQLSDPVVDAIDAYFRLHLLSHRLVQPHGVNLDGIFGHLTNVAWTNCGPVLPDDVAKLKFQMLADGAELWVKSVDKFPQMTDYVVPDGVRIANADRARLGAHLAVGTTVMHEGFVNFNAGTQGTSMVEGRISAGVVVGNGSDIGGGASIMGTLSGGGKEVISVGEGCLLGANSGIGICLGDNCVVEAGLYVTAGTVVVLPDGKTAKASELSGQNHLLFRRNSLNGNVEVIPRTDQAIELNESLHSN